MKLYINDKKLLDSNWYKKISISVPKYNTLDVEVVGNDLSKGMEMTSALPISLSMDTNSISSASKSLAQYFIRSGYIKKVVQSKKDGLNCSHFKGSAQEFALTSNDDFLPAYNSLSIKFNDDRLNFLENNKYLNKIILLSSKDESSFDIIEDSEDKQNKMLIFKFCTSNSSSSLLYMLDRNFITYLLSYLIIQNEDMLDPIELDAKTINKLKDNKMKCLKLGDKIIYYDLSFEKEIKNATRAKLARMINNEERQYKLHF